ncbi:MAG TPA: prepilin-type N-terminal cleavage/methylation domain-containing protein [Gaiellaceae bacterium]|nr:prepilin-type N-terminal cleavage/methylation domain-containing protein [Gaiellaceae bacterium]
MRSGSVRRDGFTLLELMLAMTALALLSAICYGAFHLAVRAMERGEVAVMTAQRLRATSDVLRQIRSAMYRMERNADGDLFPYFRGTSTSMTFDTSMQLQGGGGVSRVRYQVLENPTRLELTESDVPANGALRDDTDETTYQRSTVLLEGFQTLRFRYIDVGGEEHSSWDPNPELADFDQEGLPLAVRIEIEGVPGIETGRWGQEIPVAIVAMNEAVSEGGADALEEVLQADDEGDVDEDDEDLDNDEDEDGNGGRGRNQRFPPQPPPGRAYTDDDLDEDE